MGLKVRRLVRDGGGLAGVSDLAARWNVSRQRARVITERDGFPAPLDTIGGGIKVWLLADVAKWDQKHRPDSETPAG
jgi:hypothetical protein